MGVVAASLEEDEAVIDGRADEGTEETMTPEKAGPIRTAAGVEKLDGETAGAAEWEEDDEEDETASTTEIEELLGESTGEGEEEESASVGADEEMTLAA